MIALVLLSAVLYALPIVVAMTGRKLGSGHVRLAMVVYVAMIGIAMFTGVRYLWGFCEWRLMLSETRQRQVQRQIRNEIDQIAADLESNPDHQY